jgi:lipoyl-dependent peroxiredoxin subunit D
VNATGTILDRLPDAAKDLRVNLQSVLGSGDGPLTPAQRWGTALAAARSASATALAEALEADAPPEVTPAVKEDAIAAAALMAMTNVYYRFRHLVGKESYGQKPARLRMQRVARPAASRLDFELMCLAVSAINGCEACIKAHEGAITAGGLGEDHVHDAVRIAAIVRGVATGLGAPE